MTEDNFHGPPWAHGPGFGSGWDRMQMFQARRGDMRGIILQALKERPMHGYEVIRSLEEASHGMWRPSPGSIYPTLQLLEEEDMVEAREEHGKKIYSLTKEGAAAADKVETRAPWQPGPHFERKKQFRRTIGETMHAFRDVMRSGNEELTAQAEEILQMAHDKMAELAKQTSRKGRK